ncbi:MAG TPA: hypothetical protein PLQ54_03055 [Armatimonadota bacterium]|nr:hypothetical protein [Armatimonadota bacterium]
MPAIELRDISRHETAWDAHFVVDGQHRHLKYRDAAPSPARALNDLEALLQAEADELALLALVGQEV